MQRPPYQKALGYIWLLTMISLVVTALISVVFTHANQPALYGVFLSFIFLQASLVVIGLLQVQAARKRGQVVTWYQQSEIPMGLSLFCFIAVFILIPIFRHLMDSYPSRPLYYLGMGVLLICLLLALVFLCLVIKYRILGLPPK